MSVTSRCRPASRGAGGARAPRARSGTAIRLLYEDDELIVADKPAGLLTIATAKERRRTLYAHLREHVRRRAPRSRVFIVHRLDRDASGLVVLAKTAGTKYALQDQFKRREAGRVYLAVVEGAFRPDRRILRSRLAQNKAHRVYSTDDVMVGRPAVTHVRVLRRLAGRSLLEVTLETGRKHQIRVHLADAGHPILGDSRYGSGDGRSRGLALHAARLRFRHPGTGEELEFRSDPPVGANPVWRVARGKRGGGPAADSRVKPPRGRGSSGSPRRRPSRRRAG